MSEILVLQCNEENIGTRIDKYISENIEKITRSAVQTIISAGRVLADGKAVSKNYKIKGTERITVEIPEPQPDRKSVV